MQQTLTVWQSLLIALWVAAVMSRSFLGGATLTLRFSPLMTGLVCGIVMHDIKSAMIITAAIQLIYMGVFSPGGTMPSEPAIAAAIAVPVALLGNKDPNSAIAVAVPVGLLGSYLYQFRFFLNTFIGKLTDRAVEELNDRKITLSVIILPTIVSFLLFAPLTFIALYFGAPVIASVVKTLQGTVVFHILEVVGGGLAAIGIATTISVIGKKSYIVFFLLAYFMSVVFTTLNITMVTYAIVGAIISAIFVLARGENSDNSAKPAMSSANDFDDDDDDF